MSKVIIDVLSEERKQLIIEKKRLEQVIVADDGYYLEIKKNKGKYVQYYRCHKLADKDEIEKDFIRKSDIDIAKKLAQAEYDRKLYMDVVSRLGKIDAVLGCYSKNRKSDLYTKLSPERKALIESDYVDDDVFIINWKGAFAGEEGNAFKERYPVETPYYTDNGEHVRSKSEKIIADKLAKEKVPYVYEPSCELNRKGLHPDFALLNVATRKTYFYEHFGMMDKAEYATVAIRKIEKYRELGYEYGKNLLYTFETGADGLSVKAITAIINDYL